MKSSSNGPHLTAFFLSRTTVKFHVPEIMDCPKETRRSLRQRDFCILVLAVYQIGYQSHRPLSVTYKVVDKVSWLGLASLAVSLFIGFCEVSKVCRFHPQGCGCAYFKCRGSSAKRHPIWYWNLNRTGLNQGSRQSISYVVQCQPHHYSPMNIVLLVPRHRNEHEAQRVGTTLQYAPHQRIPRADVWLAGSLRVDGKAVLSPFTIPLIFSQAVTMCGFAQRTESRIKSSSGYSYI